MIRPGPLSQLQSLDFSQLKFIESKDDFPPAVSGARTLASNTTYFIIGTVDLEGDRLIGGENSTLFGFSPEVSILKSTGFDDSNGAFITTEYSLPCNLVAFHDFGTEQVLDVDADGNNAGYDWNGINFLNCSNVGTVANVGNFIASKLGFLNSSGMTFDGEIGTVGFDNTLFEAASGGTSLIFPATLTLTRRMRITYSAFVNLSGETGINFSASATVPDEGYILDTVNFGGGGTYITGLDSTSEKALFVNCRGIVNTATRGGYYMANNGTATNIATAGTFQKIAGTTTQTVARKFTHSNNRLTYTGALTEAFEIKASVSFDTQIGRTYTIKLAKNGVVQDAQSIVRGTNTINLECTLFDTTELQTDDYIEIWVTSSLTGNVSITDMNLTITRLS